MSREFIIYLWEKEIIYVQEEDNQKIVEVDLDVEKGENLMLRRVLVKDPFKDEPKQRRALFRETYKILGKACKVIIDSRSTDNVLLEEVVQKLGLTKIPHVCPYKVTWLNKGQNILENE